MSERIVLDPRRVAHLSELPTTPIVKVWIGDYELSSLPPNYVVSFTMNRSPDINSGGSSFTLTLFDPHWDEIEEALTKAAYVNENGVYTTQTKVMYGYAEGVQSKIYKAYSAATYTIDLKNSGVLLTLSGIMEGTLDNTVSMNLGTGTNNPTEAAKAISREMGYQVIDSNFEPSKSMDLSNTDQYALVNDKPIDYINNTIAPQALRESDGSSGFRFYLDDTTSPPTAHFKVNEPTQSTVRTYVYQRGVNTTVLDLQMNIEWIFGGGGDTSTVTSVTTQVIDERGVLTELSHNLDTARRTVTGDRTMTSPNQSQTNINSSGYSVQQMDALLQYRMKTANIGGYKGTLRIMGDPGLKPSDFIRLITLTDKGILHHSSGVYLIEQLSDTVAGGEFTTSMQIVKTENLVDGLVIANYRKLVK